MADTAAIIFDVDRTLVDLQNFTDYGAALADLEDLLGQPGGADVPHADWDAPTLACMAILVGLAGDPRWYEASGLVAAHERAAIPASKPMPGLASAATACGPVPYALATLLPADVAREALAFHGFDVDVVIGRDPHIRPKPSGACLVEAAARLGVDVSDTVMIGDSSWDYAAAADAGAGFIGVPVTPGAFPDDVRQAPDLVTAVEWARAG